MPAATEPDAPAGTTTPAESTIAVRPMRDVAAALGVPDEHVLVYGHGKAKIDLDYLRGLPERDSRIVLVTAVSPTPAGEGKTTTSIGLADGLSRIGRRPVLALREPSMGPVFGIKGGAVGGGKAQVTPGDEINLHFTGDFAAIAEANNLLAAMVDNALHFGTHDIDPRSVAIRRSIDINDRALRSIVAGLGGRTGGVTRETGFDITAASQVMATFCMADSLADLGERLGRIVVGTSSAGEPVTAADLGAVGAMTAVLRDALAPNLVQTLEGTPAFVHGGPFANIAHGTNSVIATRAAAKLGDIVVTEAGFGADLGAEKYIDIVARQSGLAPDLTVVVATVRALKYHGGVALADLEAEDAGAVRAGSANLVRHCENLAEVFGQNVVVAVNRFAADTSAEIAAVEEAVAPLGVPAVLTDHFARGGEGALELARTVAEELAAPQASAPQTSAVPQASSRTRYCYPSALPLAEKARAIVTRVYRGADVRFEPAAARELARLEEAGWGSLPVCMAKTQYSFSTDAKALGAPEGFTVPIREVRLSAGAGFVVLISGSIMTMPGLPKRPSACDIEVVDGTIRGMH
ncbi:formate--tetrahydrofolate ligase [Peptidiphaga sp.]|jgi:formate--tetrahydrofolate ligase|uniref:formate--tetrahydrofolate ligase n=1 Tax=Peptidiphaga sp. TaxID=2848648 RepID=UPI00360AF22C